MMTRPGGEFWEIVGGELLTIEEGDEAEHEDGLQTL
jgi:hypothetical protein